MKYEDAIKYTRANSGSQLCDSGSAYGYTYNRPPPPKGTAIVCNGTSIFDASISVTQLLADCFDEFSDVQALLQAYAAAHDDLSWFEVGEKCMEALGYRLLEKDNTYNQENDFDQDFVYEVWAADNAKGDNDWFYRKSEDDDGHFPEAQEWMTDKYRQLLDAFSDPESDDPCAWEGLPQLVVLVYLHTGCDVRAGYSGPLAGVFDTDYVIPMDRCVEWSIEAVDEEDETAIAFAEKTNESGELCSGYSSNPTYHMEKLGIEEPDNSEDRICEQEPHLRFQVRVPKTTVVTEEYDHANPADSFKQHEVTTYMLFWAYPGRPYMGE